METTMRSAQEPQTISRKDTEVYWNLIILFFFLFSFFAWFELATMSQINKGPTTKGQQGQVPRVTKV